MDHYPYKVINPAGVVVLQSKVRHSRAIELDHLEHGYTITLDGKKLTKTEIKKEANSANTRR